MKTHQHRFSPTRNALPASPRCLAVVVFLAALAALAAPAYSAGTPAGTAISNQAFADYNDANGNALSRVYSNTVTTTVSQVAGVDVAPAALSSSEANGNTVYFAVDIDNTGNSSDVFDFTYTVASGWTPASVTFYADVNANGVYDAGTDTLIGTGAGPHATGTLAADGVYQIIMAVEVPDAVTAPDTSQSVISLTATSQFDNTVTDSGSYTTTVAASVITAVKTHSPASPQPGDTVTYTITLSNTGSIDGTTALLNDPIPSGMTYVPGSITYNAASRTDAGDADNADFNVTAANTVYVDVGTVSPGATVTVTFQASVNAGITAGTSITNQATVNYDSGGNPVTKTTNGDTFTVANAPAVSVTAATGTAAGDPGDAITYALTVCNDGNAADTIDLAYTSTAGWTWVLWYDANADGIAGNDGDFQLTDSDGDGKRDTGSLPKGACAPILAVSTIPAGTPDGTTDTLVVTGTSSVDTGITDTSGGLVTTVTAPLLGVVKAVSPTGSQPPGTTLTYTITATNSGSGVATSVIVTDLIPTYTTYVGSSIRTGSATATLVARSDAADGDGAQYDAGSDSVVANTPTLGAGGTFVVEFRVTID